MKCVKNSRSIKGDSFCTNAFYWWEHNGKMQTKIAIGSDNFPLDDTFDPSVKVSILAT